ARKASPRFLAAGPQGREPDVPWTRPQEQGRAPEGVWRAVPHDRSASGAGRAGSAAATFAAGTPLRAGREEEAQRLAPVVGQPAPVRTALPPAVQRLRGRRGRPVRGAGAVRESQERRVEPAPP